MKAKIAEDQNYTKLIFLADQEGNDYDELVKNNSTIDNIVEELCSLPLSNILQIKNQFLIQDTPIANRIILKLKEKCKEDQDNIKSILLLKIYSYYEYEEIDRLIEQYIDNIVDSIKSEAYDKEINGDIQKKIIRTLYKKSKYGGYKKK